MSQLHFSKRYTWLTIKNRQWQTLGRYVNVKSNHCRSRKMMDISQTTLYKRYERGKISADTPHQNQLLTKYMNKNIIDIGSALLSPANHDSSFAQGISLCQTSYCLRFS